MANQEQTVEQLFGAALDRKPEDRCAFLDSVCAGVPELRQRVDELLLAEGKVGGSLEPEPLITDANQAVTRPALEANQGHGNPFGPASVGRFASGQVIANRFAVIRYIARGGMGEVYEVEDHFLENVHVALKIILPKFAADRNTQRRFQQEVLLARKVTHPNLCPIYDIFYCDEPTPISFLTMKLLPGHSLAERLSGTQCLSSDQSIVVFRQMAEGLAALHAGGIIHRDIKPNNVMLDGAGQKMQLWITDFGMAQLDDPEFTRTQEILAGTRGYFAPELLFGGPPSHASDIYAFGVVLHEVFVGEKPQVIEGSLSVAASPRLKSSEIPPQLARLIIEFLADDPKRRCIAFQQALDSFRSPSTSALPIRSATAIWTRRHFSGAGAIAACAVAGGVRWKWDQINNLLHPLPLKRFVALLSWPPTSDPRIKPMLMGVIDAIANELARAEAFDSNLFVIPSPNNRDIMTVAKLNEVRESLGANLVLAASAIQRSNGIGLLLRVLDPSRERALREKQISSPTADQISLPDKAVRVAAELLNVALNKLNGQRAGPATQSVDAYTAFQAAEALMKQDNDIGLDDAIKKYRQAVELDPRYVVALSKLALAYCRFAALKHNSAALDLARGNCETALALDPNSVEAHTALVSVLEQKGNVGGALREIGKTLALDPANPRTLVWQAQIYVRLNRWQDAEDAFRRVLRVRPNNWVAHNELGFLFNAEGKYPEAMAEFRAASLAAPQNALAVNNIAAIDLQLGEPADAIDTLKKSLALKPTALAAATMATALRSEGKLSEALTFAQKSVDLDPDDSANWLELGDCYSMLRGHEGDAKKAYGEGARVQNEAMATNSSDGPGWILLALCRAKAGSTTGCRSMIDKADSMFAGDLDSQLYKARALEVLGQRDDALQTLAACFKRGATDFQVQQMPDMGDLRKDLRYQMIFASDSSKNQSDS